MSMYYSPEVVKALQEELLRETCAAKCWLEASHSNEPGLFRRLVTSLRSSVRRSAEAADSTTVDCSC